MPGVFYPVIRRMSGLFLDTFCQCRLQSLVNFYKIQFLLFFNTFHCNVWRVYPVASGSVWLVPRHVPTVQTSAASKLYARIIGLYRNCKCPGEDGNFLAWSGSGSTVSWCVSYFFGHFALFIVCIEIKLGWSTVTVATKGRNPSFKQLGGYR